MSLSDISVKQNDCSHFKFKFFELIFQRPRAGLGHQQATWSIEATGGARAAGQGQSRLRSRPQPCWPQVTEAGLAPCARDPGLGRHRVESGTGRGRRVPQAPGCAGSGSRRVHPAGVLNAHVHLARWIPDSGRNESGQGKLSEVSGACACACVCASVCVHACAPRAGVCGPRLNYRRCRYGMRKREPLLAQGRGGTGRWGGAGGGTPVRSLVESTSSPPNQLGPHRESGVPPPLTPLSRTKPAG